MGYLFKFLLAVMGVLLWHMYGLDPNTAQLKDVLQLLHSDEVHTRICIGFLLLVLIDDGVGAGVSYSSVHRSTPADSRFGGFVKREDK